MIAALAPEQTVSHDFLRLAVERASMLLVVSVCVVVAAERASMMLVVSVAVFVVVVEFAVTEVVFCGGICVGGGAGGGGC